MSLSKIEWTDRTWNPVRGCSRISEGCRNCYAERFAARYSAPGLAFHGYAEPGPRWTGKVALMPEKLEEPLGWKKPARVFVNSMSDLFHESLDQESIARVFGVMAAASDHTFQVLTKRASRMRAFMRESEDVADFFMGQHSHAELVWPPPNVWLGVSVEDQATADKRIPGLLETPAAVRFVSYEPALGPVEFEPYMEAPAGIEGGVLVRPGGLDWIIVGGESGPGARPFDLAWARSTVASCRAAGVPVFVKQMGAQPVTARDGAYATDLPSARTVPVRLASRKGGDPEEWPQDLRVREFPEVRS